MSFTENLYLKRMIQQLHEENLKLKGVIDTEVLREQLYYTGTNPRFPKKTTNPLFGPGSWVFGSDLHPTNPLRVDDADTGSAPHPGEEGAVDDMPTNPFPTPSNIFKPNPFSKFRPHPHFPNPYREKIGRPDKKPTPIDPYMDPYTPRNPPHLEPYPFDTYKPRNPPHLGPYPYDPYTPRNPPHLRPYPYDDPRTPRNPPPPLGPYPNNPYKPHSDFPNTYREKIRRPEPAIPEAWSRANLQKYGRK